MNMSNFRKYKQLLGGSNPLMSTHYYGFEYSIKSVDVKTIENEYSSLNSDLLVSFTTVFAIMYS